jgi:hypothetical protein
MDPAVVPAGATEPACCKDDACRGDHAPRKTTAKTTTSDVGETAAAEAVSGRGSESSDVKVGGPVIRAGDMAWAEDYSFVQGRVMKVHSSFGRYWQLRYADYDQVDEHGGNVVLVGPNLPPDLQDGDLVRVDGKMLEHDERILASKYYASLVTVLARHDSPLKP